MYVIATILEKQIMLGILLCQILFYQIFTVLFSLFSGAMPASIPVQPTAARRSVATPTTSDPRRSWSKPQHRQQQAATSSSSNSNNSLLPFISMFGTLSQYHSTTISWNQNLWLYQHFSTRVNCTTWNGIHMYMTTYPSHQFSPTKDSMISPLNAILSCIICMTLPVCINYSIMQWAHNVIDKWCKQEKSKFLCSLLFFSFGWFWVSC